MHTWTGVTSELHQFQSNAKVVLHCISGAISRLGLQFEVQTFFKSHKSVFCRNHDYPTTLRPGEAWEKTDACWRAFNSPQATFDKPAFESETVLWLNQDRGNFPSHSDACIHQLRRLRLWDSTPPGVLIITVKDLLCQQPVMKKKHYPISH